MICFWELLKLVTVGEVQDTAETLWEQRVGLEMKASFLSLDLGILVFMEFVVLYFFSFGI